VLRAATDTRMIPLCKDYTLTTFRDRIREQVDGWAPAADRWVGR
jgi:hypothetical protein